LDRLTIVKTPVSTQDKCAALEVRSGIWKTFTFLRNPEVPGRWSEKGVVVTVEISIAIFRTALMKIMTIQP
jgi:hypothetical protein